MTGFYTVQTSTESYLQTDYHGTRKKEKKELLVKPKSYSGPRQDSQTASFPKNGQRLKPVN